MTAPQLRHEWDLMPRDVQESWSRANFESTIHLDERLLEKAKVASAEAFGGKSHYGFMMYLYRKWGGR